MAAVRNKRLAARLHWALLPYAHSRPPREEREYVNWHWWWLFAYWAMKVVERLPGSNLFPPPDPIECDCDYCRGVPGAVWEP